VQWQLSHIKRYEVAYYPSVDGLLFATVKNAILAAPAAAAHLLTAPVLVRAGIHYILRES